METYGFIEVWEEGTPFLIDDLHESGILSEYLNMEYGEVDVL